MLFIFVVVNFLLVFFFFFNDTATTEIYTLSLHTLFRSGRWINDQGDLVANCIHDLVERSEEHTSELQSHVNLVCRLLLEKKKTIGRVIETSSTHHPSPSCQCLRKRRVGRSSTRRRAAAH